MADPVGLLVDGVDGSLHHVLQGVQQGASTPRIIAKPVVLCITGMHLSGMVQYTPLVQNCSGTGLLNLSTLGTVSTLSMGLLRHWNSKS